MQMIATMDINGQKTFFRISRVCPGSAYADDHRAEALQAIHGDTPFLDHFDGVYTILFGSDHDEIWGIHQYEIHQAGGTIHIRIIHHFHHHFHMNNDVDYDKFIKSEVFSPNFQTNAEIATPPSTG